MPQFIETETKLVGPFTLKQFLWIAGGLSMSVLEFMILNGIVSLIAIMLTLAFFGTLAFIKIDGQPLVNYIAYILAYGLGAKQYLFKSSKEQTDVKFPGT